MPISVNEEQLNDLIKNSELVFVDFWAKWCAPCKAFEPIYTEVALENPDIVFAQVNIEEHEALANIFEIQSIPHLMVFKSGMIIYSDSGSIPKSALIELCQQARSLDINTLIEEDSTP